MSGKTQVILLTVLKGICVMLAVVFLCLQLSQGKISNTRFDVMHQAVSAAADMTYMQEADSQMIRRLYGLDPDSFAGAALYYPLTNMEAQELLLIKLTDPAQQNTVSDAVQARLATQKASFDGYGVTQYAMLENAVLELQGNYVIFIVAEDPAAVRDVFLDTL